MFNFITGLVLILFLMIMAIVYKVNIFEILMENTSSRKLSSRRFGMMVCLWILADIGITLIKAETISKGDIIVLIVFSLLAFSPRLLGKLIDKILEFYGKKNEN